MKTEKNEKLQSKMSYQMNFDNTEDQNLGEMRFEIHISKITNCHLNTV